MPDLAADLDRIRHHIPCLEAALRDESAPPLVVAAVAAELAAWRLLAELVEHQQTDPDGSGTTRSDSEHLETEAGHGH
jgi:hypothetical protein